MRPSERALMWYNVAWVLCIWQVFTVVVVVLLEPPLWFSIPALGVPMVIAVWRLRVIHRQRLRGEPFPYGEPRYPIRCLDCDQTTWHGRYVDICPSCGGGPMVPMPPDIGRGL